MRQNYFVRLIKSEGNETFTTYIIFSDDSDDCVPYSKEACEEAVTSLGLQLGGAGTNFVGSFSTKGCYAYDKGKYNGMAFYGTGGSDEQTKKPFGAHLYEQHGIYRPLGYDCEGNLCR